MAFLYLVVPVFNEEGNVERVITHIRALRSEIAGQLDVQAVFVDDGSTDETMSMIGRTKGDQPVTVLRHDRNRGPGAAFGTAFAHLQSVLSNDDWVVTMEGDNTSRLGTLRQMLVRRFEGFDVVLASPYTYGGGFTHTAWHRVFLSHVANGLAKMVLGIRGINTFSCFFRLYSASVLKRLAVRYGDRIIELSGFECMLELLCKLIYQHATISEVPLKVDTSARAGKSKMKIKRTMLGYLKVMCVAKRWKRTSKHCLGSVVLT